MMMDEPSEESRIGGVVVRELEPDPDDPPSSVLVAIRLMYVAAVVGLLASGIQVMQRYDTWNQLFALYAEEGLPVNQAVSLYHTMLGVAAVLGPLGALFWVWAASMNRRGYRWARMTASTFLYVDVLGVLWLFDRHAVLAPHILGLWVATLACAGIAVILTWHSTAQEFYHGDDDPGAYDDVSQPDGSSG